MTIADGALEDGRQSARALEIQRGACRLLRALGAAPLTELTLADGRRADIAALFDNGDIWMVEVKSSLADFRADQKWPDYLAWCDRLFFAVAPDFPREILPAEAGILLADRYGAEIVVEAPVTRLPAARRKAVTHRFARAAALRLMTALDPEGAVPERWA
ncbi:MAG: MmcB family DNA repair protein [Hyphomicrobiaceae bacterium]